MIRCLKLLLAAVTVMLAACASIPPEAPELSAQLGQRISAIELAHQRLVGQFFTDRRQRVDDFVQQVWVPAFAAEFFNDPVVDRMWKDVVASSDPQDRLKFITIVGPRLQQKINAKRIELVKPLDDLEREVLLRLKRDYDQARAINNTLTAFLQSASKVDANRKRYLDMLGVNEQQVDHALDEADQAVATLVGQIDGTRDKLKDGEAFVNRIKAIVAKVKP